MSFLCNIVSYSRLKIILNSLKFISDFYSYLPAGVQTINVEIYDESAFTMDELIAYGTIQIPDAVFRNESVDGWFQLSGKQGEDKEGSVHLIISLMPIANILPLQMAMSSYTAASIGGSSVVPAPQVVGYGAAIPAYAVYSPNSATGAILPPRNAAPMQLAKPLTDEETKEIERMFPSLDPLVIQSVIEACGGRREVIIDSLLQISEQ